MKIRDLLIGRQADQTCDTIFVITVYAGMPFSTTYVITCMKMYYNMTIDMSRNTKFNVR